MDKQGFIQLLSAGSSGDQKAAEQLQELEKAHIVEYYSLLCQLLADPAQPPTIRTLSMISLSNTVSGRSPQQTKLLQGRWISQDAAMRAQIRQLLLSQLNSPLEAIRLTAIKSVASIAVAEIPLGQWPDAISQLALAAQNNLVALPVRISSITIIGQICAELTHECSQLTQHTHSILNCIATTVGDQNIDLRIAGIKALGESLKFCSQNFEKESDRRLLMQMMCSAATPAPPDPVNFEKQFELQAAAWDCLITVVGHYYSSLESFIVEIFNCSVATIQQSLTKIDDYELKAATELASIQAIEFWISVAKNEDKIEEEIEAAREENEQSDLHNLHYTQHALTQIVPLLLQCMCLQPDQVENEVYNIPLSALNCLTEFATQCDISIFTIVIPQIQTNIQSPDWRYRDAACTALGCLLSSPHTSDQQISATLTQALSIVTTLVQDQSDHVSLSAAWCLSQFSRHLPHVVLSNLEYIFQHAYLPLLTVPRHRTTSNICSAISELCDAVRDEEEAAESEAQAAAIQYTHKLSPIFQPLVHQLLAISETSTDATLLINSYEALASLIACGAGHGNLWLQSLLQILGQRLQQSIQQFNNSTSIQTGDDISSYKVHAQGLLCGALSVLIGKLPVEFVKANAVNLLNVFSSVLNTDPAVSIEALTGIEAIVYVLDKDFEPHAAAVYQQLIPLISNQLEAGQVVSRAFTVISTVASFTRVCSIELADPIFTVILQVLSVDSADQMGKLGAIACVGDLAQILKDKFLRYFHDVHKSLSNAFTWSLTKEHKMLDADLVEYLLSLQIAVSSAFDAIVIALSREGAPQDNFKALAGSIQHLIFNSVFMLQDTEATSQTRLAALNLLTDIFEALPEIDPQLGRQVVSSEIPAVIRSISTSTRGKVRKAAMGALASLALCGQ